MRALKLRGQGAPKNLQCVLPGSDFQVVQRARNWRKTGIIFHNAPGGFTGEKERDMTTLKIKGMTCRHCVMAVTKALGGINGIRDVQVDLERGEAAFTEEKPVDRALIRERIVKAGFDVAG